MLARIIPNPQDELMRRRGTPPITPDRSRCIGPPSTESHRTERGPSRKRSRAIHDPAQASGRAMTGRAGSTAVIVEGLWRIVPPLRREFARFSRVGLVLILLKWCDQNINREAGGVGRPRVRRQHGSVHDPELGSQSSRLAEAWEPGVRSFA